MQDIIHTAFKINTVLYSISLVMVSCHACSDIFKASLAALNSNMSSNLRNDQPANSVSASDEQLLI